MGTNLFIVGCALYLVAAILNMISMNIKAMRHVEENDTESKAQTEQDKLEPVPNPLPPTMGKLQADSPPEEEDGPAMEICKDLLEEGKAAKPVARAPAGDITSI